MDIFRVTGCIAASMGTTLFVVRVLKDIEGGGKDGGLLLDGVSSFGVLHEGLVSVCAYRRGAF